jgi:hypothetical protein
MNGPLRDRIVVWTHGVPLSKVVSQNSISQTSIQRARSRNEARTTANEMPNSEEKQGEKSNCNRCGLADSFTMIDTAA